MLNLTIKDGEKLFIEDDIVITISKGSGSNQHRVGVTAPHDVSILREKLLSNTKGKQKTA
jgi:carbon storage regulator CsrA